MVRSLYRRYGALALGLASFPSWGWAQRDTAGFDITRVQLKVDWPAKPFQVRETQLLADALRAGTVEPSTSLLVLDRPGGRVALITDQMVMHHLAQGELNGEPWLVSFCVPCNTGVGMTPRVDGRVHHFAIGGVYNALMIMRDEETGTLWDHITGAALHGPLQGKKLPTNNLLQMSAGRAIEAYPDLRIAISDRRFHRGHTLLQRLARRSGALRFFPNSIAREDTRRPTMDLGLGVWSATVHRYYPLEYLGAAGNAIVHELDGRPLVVARDAAEGSVDAFYAATLSASWEGKELRLDSGQVYRNGVLYNRAGARVELERPMQLFTRWYGFSLTFPKTEIYQPPQRTGARQGEQSSP